MVKVLGAVGRDGKRLVVSADQYLINDLKRLRKRNKQGKWDINLIVAGNRGDGKSTMALTTIAPLLAGDVKDIYVTFGTDATIPIMAHSDTNEESVFIVDEINELTSGQHQAHAFKRFRTMIMLCRQRRYYIILILPSFFLLNKVFAIFTSNILYQVTAEEDRRGYFSAYGRDTKRILYIKGLKYMDQNAQSSDYDGSFYKNDYLLDEVCPNYLKKKLAHFRSMADDDKLPGAGIREARADYILGNVMLNFLRIDKKLWTHEKIGDFCGVSGRKVKKLYSLMKAEGKVPDALLKQLSWSQQLSQDLANPPKNPLKSTKKRGERARNSIYTGKSKKPIDKDEESEEKEVSKDEEKEFGNRAAEKEAS